MSYTPSLTSTSFDLNTSSPQSGNNIEDFSSIGESIDAWYHETSRNNDIDHTSQQQSPASHEDVDVYFAGLFNYPNNASFASSGAWVDDDPVVGDSSQGSGELSPNEMQSDIYNATNSHNIQDGLSPSQLASLERLAQRFRDENANVTDSSIHVVDAPSSTSSGTTNAIEPTKRQIDRNPHPSYNQRAKQRAAQFTCTRCKVPCKRSADLQRHLRDVHHEGPMFECVDCLRRRGRLDKIKDHCRKKHKQVKGFETWRRVI